MPKTSKNSVAWVQISVIATVLGLGLPLAKAQSCKWVGTAPYCAGTCPTGYVEKNRSNCGDGACCRAGYKAYCCPPATVPPPASCAPPVGTKIALKADTGSFYTRCNSCQKSADGKVPDTVTVHASTATGPAVFTVVDAKNGRVGLKADNGKYVARCNGCIVGAPADMLTVHAIQPSPITFEKLANGKCVLKLDNGKYAGRCNGCTPGSSVPNVVSVKDTDTSQPYVQLVVTKVQ